jgi:CO dehydrogenase maturation factor
MAYIVALAGKGGTGKTTVAAVLVAMLLEENRGSVLAVDADPNYNLGLALGVQVNKTIADVREQIMQEKLSLPQEMSKDRIVEYEIQKVLEERKGFALLTMGRPEGPGCYCYINHILRKYLDILTADYPFAIIDNEAGMEHLSRRTTNNVDHLVITALPEIASVLAAERISEMARSLPITVRRISVILNCVRSPVPDYLLKRLEKSSLSVLTQVPYDSKLEKSLSEEKPLLETAAQTALFAALRSAEEKIFSPGERRVTTPGIG